MMKYLSRLLILVAILVSLGFVKPTQAQTGLVWTSQFFNNPNLSGTPVLTRTDNAIAFDWGTGSPAAGTVPADSFSARFTTTVFFQAGTYQFSALADDSVRLFVDGNLLIDTFGEAAHGQTLTANVALAAGNHSIQLDYQEASEEAFVYLNWSFAGSSPNLPFDQLWSAEYFSNTNLSGTPTYTATEPSPTHYWQSDAPVNTMPANGWSARWTNTQTLGGGTYRLTVRADDGVRVYIDGVPYINEWHESSNQTYTTTLNLNAGQHTFVIHYYENQGLAYLDYKFENVTVATPPVTGAGTFVEITAFALRVRAEPNLTTGTVLTQVQEGQVYPVLAQSQDGLWYQINANGIIGWVYGEYVEVTGATGQPTTPPATVITAQVNTGNLNVRAGASTGFGILTVIPRGTVVEVAGRDLAGNWLQVRVNGIQGWVSSQFVTLQAGVTTFQLPVIG